MFDSQNIQYSLGLYDLPQAAHIELIKNNEDKDIFTVSDTFNSSNRSLVDIVNSTAEFIRVQLKVPVRISGVSNENYTLTAADKQNATFMVSISRSSGRSTSKSKMNVGVTISGSQEVMELILGHLDSFYSTKNAEIDWWYISNQGPRCTTVTLDNKNFSIHPEFYPWFKEGPHQFFAEFLKSSAPILFLSGEPGTGKTSFLREMILKHNLSAAVGYDTKLLESDGMFISFLCENRDGMMIIEDAESLVLPRSKNNNSMMARFLNVSDGLIKIPGKKFIFTTNDNDFNNVDPALIRPGRCYASVEFRKLTFDEAKAAVAVASLKEITEDREYTLTELFNPDAYLKKARKPGF